MIYNDLLNVMLQRMERLGLVDPLSEKADAAEAEIYLFQGLLDLVETADLTDYMVYDDAMLVTKAGDPHYVLPDNFGRLLLPRAMNKRGLYLYNGVGNTDLEYVDPASIGAYASLVPATPRKFTVIGRRLTLFAPPDIDGYTIRGTYMRAVERPELDDEVLLSYPTALIDRALLRLATDSGRQLQLLTVASDAATARLGAGNR